MKTVLLALAGAGFFTFSTLGASPSVEISTSFATDPAQQGWKTFGNSNLFSWNSTSKSLDVTWDSSNPNSYYYHPLGTVLTRNDDFTMEFDLTIKDLAGSFELSLGFMNLGQATGSGFLRGTGSDAFNLAELDYFPPGDFWGGGVAPTFAASNLWNQTFASPLSSGWFDYTLPLNTPLHVVVSYAGATSTATTTISANGSSLVSGDFTIGKGFTDYRCDTFAIECYNDTGAFGGNVQAHGSVQNVKLTVPPAPLKNVSGRLLAAGWTVTFDTQTNWTYALERSSDLVQWTAVGSTIDGTGAACTLQDGDSATGARFYRVRAQRPN